MAWPSEAGILGPITSRHSRGAVPRRRSLAQITAPPMGRKRYYSRHFGLWHAFNDAVYRFYLKLGSPPSPGDTPTSTSATLPKTLPGLFADGTYYLSVSYFNGVLDSGFLPIGAQGQTWQRFDIVSNNDIALPPQPPTFFSARPAANNDTRVFAVYAEEGATRADKWVIYTTIDFAPDADPISSADRQEVDLPAGGVAILEFTAAASNFDGLYTIVLVRTMRGSTESENLAVYYFAGDDQPPNDAREPRDWTGSPPLG